MIFNAEASIALALKKLDNDAEMLVRKHITGFENKMREYEETISDIKAYADRCEELCVETEAMKREVKMTADYLSKERKALHDQHRRDKNG